MDDAERIISAIDSLKELTEAKLEATNSKVDMVHQDVSRNQKSIAQLYDFDRKQGEDIAILKKDVAPAISHASDSKKLTWAFILAFVGAIGVAFKDEIARFFKS